MPFDNRNHVQDYSSLLEVLSTLRLPYIDICFITFFDIDAGNFSKH